MALDTGTRTSRTPLTLNDVRESLPRAWATHTADHAGHEDRVTKEREGVRGAEERGREEAAAIEV